jgi:hypothetical protein
MHHLLITAMASLMLMAATTAPLRAQALIGWTQCPVDLPKPCRP